MKDARQNNTLCMIPFIQNVRKCKLTYAERKAYQPLLGMGRREMFQRATKKCIKTYETVQFIGSPEVHYASIKLYFKGRGREKSEIYWNPTYVYVPHQTWRWMAAASCLGKEQVKQAASQVSAAALVLTLNISVPGPGAPEHWHHLPS